MYYECNQRSANFFLNLTKLNYLFLDIAHSEELWLFPCQHCEFKAQGPKYLREHILTCPHCPSNSTKDITEEKDKSIPNIQSIQSNTEEINIVIEAIEEEPKSSRDDIVTEEETKSSKDNVVNEEKSIGKYLKKF